MPRQQSTSTHWLVWLIWPKGNIGNGKKGFANASDYLETWDDSDSITAVNAQNDLRHPEKSGMITQHHNINVLRPAMNIRK